jgi:hypothetical protein
MSMFDPWALRRPSNISKFDACSLSTVSNCRRYQFSRDEASNKQNSFIYLFVLVPDAMSIAGAADAFLATTVENGDMNQYWYSRHTIEALVSEVMARPGLRCAFLSTPSLFFAIPADQRSQHVVFDYDKQWKHLQNYCFYDFNKPEGE